MAIVNKVYYANKHERKSAEIWGELLENSYGFFFCLEVKKENVNIPLLRLLIEKFFFLKSSFVDSVGMTLSEGNYLKQGMSKLIRLFLFNM